MAQRYDALFCAHCGTLLTLAGAKASCGLCKSEKSLSELAGVCFTFECSPEELARKQQVELQQVSPQHGGGGCEAGREEAATTVRQRATVDDDCPKCGHRGLEYYTMQLRSADEGQTVFYECPQCGHKFSQHT